MFLNKRIHNFKLKKQFLLIISLIVFFFSCTHRLEKPIQDDAARFYKEGLGFLHNYELVQAEVSFNQALQIQKDYAPAYEGLARVYFQRGKYGRAENLAKKSHQLNPNWMPARIIKARIYLAEGDYDLSRDELLIALEQVGSLKLPALRSTIHQLLAKNYLLQRNFSAAEKHLKTALDLKADNAEALQTLHEIEEDLAVLRGRQNGVLEVAAKPVITRADFAVILFQELQNLNTINFEELHPDSRPAARDVRSEHEYFEAVQFCLKNKLLPLLPDSTFRPKDKVDRAEAAIFLKNMLPILRYDSADKIDSFSTKKSLYKDVTKRDVYYSAVAAVTNFKLMSAETDGYFMAQKILSGLQAVKIISRLKEMLISK